MLTNEVTITPAPTALVLTKKFTSGNLTGLTYIEYLPFVSRISAHSWLKGVRLNQEKGSLNWEFDGEIFWYNDALSKEQAIEDYKTWAC